jgi:hypothetical protein
MSLCGRINKKVDSKMESLFPDDPYADFTIKLQKRHIKLSLAYLSMESALFASIPPGTSFYDLSAYS